MSAHKLIKINLKRRSQYTFWHIFNIIITGLLLTGIILAIFFIYQNINTALSNTTIINNFRSGLKFDNLDINEYEKIKKKINEKKNLKPVNKNFRNIFKYSEVPKNLGPNVTSTTINTVSAASTSTKNPTSTTSIYEQK